jgi:tetratricopeptide (TPR) repeat protein
LAATNVVEMSNLDNQAYALMQSALADIPRGHWAQAAEALESAAALHAKAGRAYDEARCLQLAATLRRSAGELNEAQTLGARASSVAQRDEPLSVSIDAERAETAFAQQRYQEAASLWTKAIERAREAGLLAEGLSAMLRRRAAALMALYEIERAGKDFNEAYALLNSSSAKESASFVRVEQARLFWQYGEADRAEQLLNELETKADVATNSHLMAELLVMRSRMTRAAGKVDASIEFARRSREAALQAVAPLSYFAASLELAEGLQLKEDLMSAYETLATAWATLSDVLGKETARSWVEPCLIAFRARWGDEAFLKAKSDYEARRRAEIKSRAQTSNERG